MDKQTTQTVKLAVSFQFHGPAPLTEDAPTALAGRVVKALLNHIHQIGELCPAEVQANGGYTVDVDAVPLAAPNGVAWISTQDRLPEPFKRVLVCYDGTACRGNTIDICWVDEGLWWKDRQTALDRLQTSVHHWLPLPDGACEIAQPHRLQTSSSPPSLSVIQLEMDDDHGLLCPACQAKGEAQPLRADVEEALMGCPIYVLEEGSEDGAYLNGRANVDSFDPFNVESDVVCLRCSHCGWSVNPNTTEIEIGAVREREETGSGVETEAGDISNPVESAFRIAKLETNCAHCGAETYGVYYTDDGRHIASGCTTPDCECAGALTLRF